MVNKIVIVGGGSAGWLTAGIIASRYHKNSERHVRVTLIESPDVNTIGVGEGTWPTMRTTLKRIGISETEFITHCDASFKQGSKFVGWINSKDDVYYHPFTLPGQKVTPSFISAWRVYFADLPFADAASFQSRLCDHGVAPKLITMAEYAGAANYAYHLDAGKFVELLTKHCTQKLGVEYIRDHVNRIQSKENGDVTFVTTRNCGDISADLFIDCSGTSGVLLAGHYRIPFVSIRDYSFNDSALAMQIPYSDDNAAIASSTIATAKPAGWIWDIGLASRRGVGYVYSNAHTDKESAERVIRAYAAETVGQEQADSLAVKKLSFEPGYRAEFWRGNVVAIGMSAGFIEPLEASALALVELSANAVRDELPTNREEMHIVAKRFNKLFIYRWQRIVEFLKLHYALSGRVDTEYWLDAKRGESLPDGLKEMLELWKHRPPYYNDFPHAEEIFPEASYQYVLYGMKFQHNLPFVHVPESSPEVLMIKESFAKSEQYLRNLPKNRELIESLQRHGMSKI